MEIERLGPYRIVGKLGRGGMGTVYEGVHSETGEPAAVKLLAAALAGEEGFRSRFEAEIETLKKLNHPNIVRLFGFGEQDGHLFYAMELVDGNSLEEELRRGRRFDWREVARLTIQICRALRHAHDRGIIHRDIKPGNLLLKSDGQVKLSDFGIARLFGYSRLTSAGSVLGTAEYMSPEQAEGRPVDARADLYSLGAVMYALLAQRPPFRAKSLLEMLQKQRFEQPEPLRKYAADVPAEMEQIIGQLLEKDPARRIVNADLLARRLEAMLRALSLEGETLPADAAWFFPDRTVPPIALSETSATETPADDLPPTLALTEKSMAADEYPIAAPPEQAADKAASAPAAATSGRFVVVSEEELGRVGEEEEPRPALISLQTWALAGSLLLLGLVAWWFLQPPSADALYKRIVAKTADETIESILLAENDIREFLNRYSSDPRAAHLRTYEREIDLYRLEKRFELRLKGLGGSENLQPIERAYLEAINYLRLDPELGRAKLQAIVDLYDRPGNDKEPEGQCLTLVRRRLAQLRQQSEKHAAEQLALLQERLDAADALRNTDPERAEAVYRAVIELYGHKQWAAAAVRRAQEALRK